MMRGRGRGRRDRLYQPGVRRARDDDVVDDDDLYDPGEQVRLPPAARRPNPIGSDDTTILQSLQRSFNTCPICRMPLYVDPDATDGSDEEWRRLQFCFKGKPSYIIQGVGARNKHAFGFTFPLSVRRADSTDACHFVHESASRGATHYKSIWNQCSDPQAVEMEIELNSFQREPPKKAEFLEQLHIGYSIFSGTEPTATAHMLDRFIFNATGVINTALMNEVTTHINREMFAGCIDCNSKMTQMAKIPALFVESFPYMARSHDAWIQPAFMLNAQINYLLLQGCLKPGDACHLTTHAPYLDASGRQIFRVNPKQQMGWKMKLGVMWMYIMIFLTNLNLNDLFKDQTMPAAHHTVYIYAGISDFYLSMLLYLIYVANFPRDLHRAYIQFEEFHYFYSSNFVFFLRHQNKLKSSNTANPMDFSNSLTAAILGAGCCPTNGAAWFEAPLGLGLNTDSRYIFNNARSFITQIHNQLGDFCQTYWNAFCHQLYAADGNAASIQRPIFDYFASIKRADDLVHASRSTRKSVQGYTTLLGPDHYWFHFKNITMPQICKYLAISREYYTPTAYPVIDNWARLALYSAEHLHGQRSSEGKAIQVGCKGLLRDQ